MKVLLVGAGGYGVKYVDYLLQKIDPTLTLAGVVEPYFDACARREEILAAGVPVWESMEKFYAVSSAELAIICTPPFLHERQSILALENGSFVLCEKPVAPTLDAARRMAQAEKRHGKWIAIGYQWSFAPAILALKRDILSGRLGKPRTLKTIVSWPRKKAYYGRGIGWAGRIEKDGITILDSIVSNACAHYVHNMLFLLGEDMHSAALPLRVEAECLRAYRIETFDTCVLRAKMAQGAVTYFIASHAADERLDPQFVYEFEKATVTYTDGQIIADLADGSRVFYGDPFENEMRKITDCAHAIEVGTCPPCTVETASAHTALIGALHRHIGICEFSPETVRENEEKIWVDGLCAAMRACYTDTALLSERGMDTVPFRFKLGKREISELALKESIDEIQ